MHGIWAWDCVDKTLVLLIPSVLALLGDNPMQSEMACHGGLMAKLFCRVCWVNGKVEGGEDEEAESGEGGKRGDARSEAGSDVTSDSASDSSIPAAMGSNWKKRRKRVAESLADMTSRISRFMEVSVHPFGSTSYR